MKQHIMSRIRVRTASELYSYSAKSAKGKSPKKPAKKQPAKRKRPPTRTTDSAALDAAVTGNKTKRKRGRPRKEKAPKKRENGSSSSPSIADRIFEPETILKTEAQTPSSTKIKTTTTTTTTKLTKETRKWKKMKNGTYACRICHKDGFSHRYKVSRHISTCHEPPVIYTCDNCSKTFKSKFLMKEHMNQHRENSGDYLYCCDKCEYQAKSKYYLKTHMARKHSDEYNYGCDHCPKRFKIKGDLKFHLGTHNDTHVMCDICGKMYTSQDSLLKHRRVVHVNTYRFRCPVCNQKLLTQETLDKHMRKHDQPFSCDECNLKFTKKYYVTRHKKRVHQLEKNQECQVCQKKFTCSSTLRIHYLTHARAKPYLCNACGLRFTQRSSMMLHWKKKHPEAEERPPPVILTNFFGEIESEVSKLVENNQVHISKRQSTASTSADDQPCQL